MEEIKRLNAVTKIYAIPFRGLGEVAMNIGFLLYLIIDLFKKSFTNSHTSFPLILFFGFAPLLILLITILFMDKSRFWYFKRYGKVKNIKYLILSVLIPTFFYFIAYFLYFNNHIDLHSIQFKIYLVCIQLFGLGLILYYIKYIKFSYQYIFFTIISILFLFIPFINDNKELKNILFSIIGIGIGYYEHYLITHNLKVINNERSE